ncbi:MAG: hypothetical protein ACE5ES_01385 [Candidatus Nanoarchaeia archaeon]
MENNESKLSSLSKEKLIEIIHEYEEKVAVMEDCSDLLRVESM